MNEFVAMPVEMAKASKCQTLYEVQVGDIIEIPLSTITKDFKKWVHQLKDFRLIGDDFAYKRKLFKILHFPKWHIFGERYVTYQYVGSRKEG